MKKKILTAVMILSSALMLFGCGKKEEETTEVPAADKAVKEEIVKFVNVELPGIVEDRNTAVATYNAYFAEGADLDSAKWLEQLQGEAIVDYEVYLYNLKAIEVTSPEVVELKNLYIESAQSQYDAMQDVIKALTDADNSYLTSAKSKIADSEDALLRYEERLKTLCENYDITINGAFTELGKEDAVDAPADDTEAADAPADDTADDSAEDAPAEE